MIPPFAPHPTECLSDEGLLRYVAGALTSEARDTIEIHLETCHACVDRVEAKMRQVDEAQQQACAFARPLFAAYAAGLLPSDQRQWVRAHLMLCDACMDHYTAFVEAQIEAEMENEIGHEPVSTKPKIIRIAFGDVRNFSALRDPAMGAQPVKLAAQSDDAALSSADLNIQEWQCEGVLLTAGLDMNDHLWVELASDAYEVAYTQVSLCEPGDSGLIEVHAVVTDAAGKADFGPICDLQPPKQSPYRIVVTAPEAI